MIIQEVKTLDTNKQFAFIVLTEEDATKLGIAFDTELSSVPAIYTVMRDKLLEHPIAEREFLENAGYIMVYIA